VILDPFMGSGSTVAAASACGLQSIGLEVNEKYFEMAKKAIPALARYQHQDVVIRNGKPSPRNGFDT